MKVSLYLVVSFLSSVCFANPVQIQSCVSNLKSTQKFTNDQAALVCAGTKNAIEVQLCVANLKSNEKFTNDQAAIACKGAGN